MSRLPANARVLAGGKRTGAGFHFEPTVIDGVFQSRRGGVRGDLRTRASQCSRSPRRRRPSSWPTAPSTRWPPASGPNNHGVVTRVSNELDFGAVWINCHQVIPAEAPHGGFKHSGTGKDLSVFGLEDYTRIKSVTTSHR